MTDLEYEIMRGILDELERQQGASEDQLRIRALREKLQAAELTRRIRSSAAPPRKPVAWATVLQWGLVGAVIIGALFAQLLGVNIKELLP